jgi:hypothetical protein
VLLHVIHKPILPFGVESNKPFTSFESIGAAINSGIPCMHIDVVFVPCIPMQAPRFILVPLAGVSSGIPNSGIWADFVKNITNAIGAYV